MIVIGDTVSSDDIIDHHFVCDLLKCKGACCVEGDLGAPLEEEELTQVENAFPAVEKYLTPEGKAAIKEQGLYIFDEDGEFSTPTVDGKECAYAFYDPKGILKCGMEKAWLEGESKFRKPISCHLYPIRVQNYAKYKALNYDRWSICSPACSNGEALKVPIYKFLKEPLIRKFGAEWYAELETEVAKREAEK